VGGALCAARRLFRFRGGFKLSTDLNAGLTPLFFGAGVAYVVAPAWTLKHVMGYALKGRDASERPRARLKSACTPPCNKLPQPQLTLPLPSFVSHLSPSTRNAAFIWRNVGGALLSALPAIAYLLKEKADAE
jgi:hypothetical protein